MDMDYARQQGITCFVVFRFGKEQIKFKYDIYSKCTIMFPSIGIPQQQQQKHHTRV